VCDGPDGLGRQNTFSVAYVGVSRGGRIPSSQIGYGYGRNILFTGDNETHNFWYVEVIGESFDDQIIKWYYKTDDTTIPPFPEGEWVNFRCELDVMNGEWSYFVNGQDINYNIYHPIWVNHYGEFATWYGELRHIENDMPGISGNRCAFDDCKIKTAGSGNYDPVYLNDYEINTDNEHEWGKEDFGLDGFYIWDKYPMPARKFVDY